MISEDDYIIIAYIGAGDVRCPLKCNRKPRPREANLIHVLAEHINRTHDVDVVCARLRMSTNMLRVTMSMLRKKLHYDWLLPWICGQGIGLYYVGGSLAEADRTYIEFTDDAELQQPRAPSNNARPITPVRIT